MQSTSDHFFESLQAEQDRSALQGGVELNSALHLLYREFGGEIRRKSYDHLRSRQVACQYVDGITYKKGPISQIVRTNILTHAAATNPDLILDKKDKRLVAVACKKSSGRTVSFTLAVSILFYI